MPTLDPGGAAGVRTRSPRPGQSPRVLIVTHEPLGRNLSGPGIRALEIARAIAESQPVVLATPSVPDQGTARGLDFATYSFDRPESLRAIADHADLLVVQGLTLSSFPLLATLRVPIVVDLYCPFTIEYLETIVSGPSREGADVAGKPSLEDEVAGVFAAQHAQLRLGDFFVCASEQQRDFWIGALHSAGRINLRTYQHDPTLRSLIDVVPFGVSGDTVEPDTDSTATRMPVMKGVRSGIAKDDHVLLWAGSILDWQDAPTLVRAVAKLAARRTDVKLFFMGTRHPNPRLTRMRAVDETIGLTRELGVLDSSVFFNDWVPYADRWRYLTEADLGLSTHRSHLETRFSFRTRMLDYLWAGLPIVCSDGDFFASLVRDRRLGLVVAPGDVDALAAAIERSIDDPDERRRCSERERAVAEEFRWRRVVTPLARYCEAPWFAADRAPAPSPPWWLASSYRFTNWTRRAAVALGVSRATIEQVKALGPVREIMSRRNRALLARAREDTSKPRS